MKISLEIVNETFAKAGRYTKARAKELYGSIKEANKDVKTNISHIREEIHEYREVGKVYKAGVTDQAVLEQLGPATKGLEDYAKANNINITFHTPQKPAEAGSNLFEQPLSITAYKDGFINSYMASRTIDGDVSKISKAQIELPSKGKKVVADVEDTFLRRVYRNISEMTQEIQSERKYNKENSFLGVEKEELKEEIKASHEQIKDGIKDFFKMFIPTKK